VELEFGDTQYHFFVLCEICGEYDAERTELGDKAMEGAGVGSAIVVRLVLLLVLLRPSARR